MPQQLEPTNEQLLKMPELRDPDRPANVYPSLDYASNQYLSASSPKLALTSTASQY